jgi:hypothetical protein
MNAEVTLTGEKSSTTMELPLVGHAFVMKRQIFELDEYRTKKSEQCVETFVRNEAMNRKYGKLEE